MNDEEFIALCELVADGKPLRPLLRERSIGKSTFYDWVDADPARKARLQAARDEGEESLALECLDIADDTASDYVPGEQGPRFDSEHVQRSKLRIDTRLKLLAKFNPKRWSDRVEIAGDKDAPITIIVRKLTHAGD